MVFVNSMSDLFHAQVPAAYIRRIFETMLKQPHHIYQILTKRPSRAAAFVRKNRDMFPGGIVPAHIWIGTSVEREDVAYRVDHIRQVCAAVRFLSCEPLLGPLDLELRGIHWVIVGGESGPSFRRADAAWVRAIRDQCLTAGVPFFFKQWGGKTPKALGRRLDGRTWNEYPSLMEAVDEPRTAIAAL
jgi:protein gp37